MHMAEGQWVKVYRKATHTDQYLNKDFNNSLEHKLSVVKTHLQSTKSLISEEKDKTKEVEHIEKVKNIDSYKTLDSEQHA